MTFEYINFYVDYLNLTTFHSYEFNVTSFNETQMVLSAEDGTTISYQRQTLSISNNDNIFDKATVSQNPVQNHLSLKLPQKTEQVKLKIFSTEGKEVIGTTYKKEEILDVSFLASGIYYISLTDAEGIITNLKMIKR
ncbi:MAG: T9SS type A sorting domain-containing protein [Flavobacterium sp.]|nr:MAG: T9SS type A sorting domain-containing protein [Flavobacterium sp.]